MNTFHTLSISEVKQETPNAVSIRFDIPGNLQHLFLFKSGQYITFKHEVNGDEIRRAYSICTTPKSGSIKVGIKKVAGGIFSEFAATQLKTGDRLEVMAPEGKFILEPHPENKKNYVAFAAGSGITPILSIIKTALEEEPQSTFSLVYGNRSKEETMFFKELNELQETHSGRFVVQYLFSREDDKNAIFGRIDRSNVSFLLKNTFKDIMFDEFYLCGPETMIDIVSSVLKENHINSKQIHFELFTTAEGDMLVEGHSGLTEVTITLDDETETFSMSQKKSILDAALDHKMDAPYSCQGGICSTCIARLVEGKAEMRKNQILTDGEIAEGLILT